MPDAYTLKQHLSICSNIRPAHPLHYYQTGHVRGESADRWQDEARWEALETEISVGPWQPPGRRSCMTRAASCEDLEVVNRLCEREALGIVLPAFLSALPPTTYMFLNAVLLQWMTHYTESVKRCELETDAFDTEFFYVVYVLYFI